MNNNMRASLHLTPPTLINEGEKQAKPKVAANTLGVLESISLFSGGGGLDLGLEAAGFQTRFENDIDPYSCSTLEMGRIAALKRGLSFFSNSVVLAADIKTIEGDFVLESSRLKRGEVSLLAGGPPCQAFSVFGNRKGRGDHRGQLVYEYFRLLSQIAPEAFLFENVYGLLTVEKGAVFKMACEQLREPRKGLRYQLSILRLNAANYGVPQFRDRIFIIGSRKGKTIQKIDELTVNPRHDIGSSQLPFRTVKDALRGLPKPNESFPANHTGRNHSARIIERYGSMDPGQRDHFTRINKLDLTKPSYTIIVGSDKGGGKGHIHPVDPREVTPRESARIQTFPDWWEFRGSVRHPIRQVGNAVPPLLGFAVANAVREQIFGLARIPVKTAVESLSQEHLFPEWFKSK
jgi:DNA (cytosine-5)-methyltransferase 1